MNCIWDKKAINILLEATGQNIVNYRNDTEGKSEGNYGTVKFQVVDNNTKHVLYLKFKNESTAKTALPKMSRALTDTYNFSARPDIMPNVVMVKFTDNLLGETMNKRKPIHESVKHNKNTSKVKNLIKKIIREELEDSGLTEESLEQSIKEYFKLQKELEALEIQLEPLLKSKKSADAQQTRILNAVQMWMEINKKDNVIVKNWVIKLSQVLKFKKPTPSYKDLWEDALRKVNKATQDVLNGHLKAHLEFKKSEKVPSLTIEPIQEVSNDSAGFAGLLKAAKAAKELHAMVGTLPSVNI